MGGGIMVLSVKNDLKNLTSLFHVVEEIIEHLKNMWFLFWQKFSTNSQHKCGVIHWVYVITNASTLET